VHLDGPGVQRVGIVLAEEAGDELVALDTPTFSNTVFT